MPLKYLLLGAPKQLAEGEVDIVVDMKLVVGLVTGMKLFLELAQGFVFDCLEFGLDTLEGAI